MPRTPDWRRGHARPAPSWRPACAGRDRCAVSTRRPRPSARAIRGRIRRRRRRYPTPASGWCRSARTHPPSRWRFHRASRVAARIPPRARARFPSPRALAQCVERRDALGLVAPGLGLGDPRDLRFAHRHVVDVENVDRVLLGELVFVDTDDRVLALVDARGAGGTGFLDHRLGPARRDRLGHAAIGLDALDDLPRFLDQFLGQALDIIRAAERIDHLGHPGLFLQHDLRVARDPGGEIGRQRDRLVERIGVERLRPAQHRRHRLDRGADDVVIRVLLGQRNARRLAMRAQHLRALVLRAEIGHHAVPQFARGAQLGDLHEEVHADGEEERQPPGKRIEIETRRHRCFRILPPVGDREGELLQLRRARFLHVIAGDRDRIEFRHVRGGVADDVRDDPHARLGRVDVCVADHELLEDVVLDGPVEQVLRHALLLASDDEESEDRDHRAVHRHRHRHLVERNAVEQDLHVVDRVDRHARLADIAGDARMVAIVAAMRREIERDRQALLPGGEVAAVERVRRFGGREARILPDRPWTPGIHRCPHTTREGRETGKARVEIGGVGGGVERLDRDPLRRVPGQVLAFDLLRRGSSPGAERRVGQGLGQVARRRRTARILADVRLDRGPGHDRTLKRNIIMLLPRILQRLPPQFP
ncbi:unnamed protein product [Rhizophagus irregularis]|uniref:Uncharacterized protein n=1 Tax=Rhizophagus irregularis TaxID=588596 RepID=A0A916EJ25_9GLOM|nr:unnamed protein product [Rhizophagus irregularis]